MITRGRAGQSGLSSRDRHTHHVTGIHMVMSPGADPGFEKGGGAGGSEASFEAYLGQFRGLFKEIGAKTGGRASPAPPSGSAPGVNNRLLPEWSDVQDRMNKRKMQLSHE